MEMEYRDNGRRGKLIIALGVILALVAGGTSFFLLNQASQSAGQGPLQKITIVVAARNIQARTPVVPADVSLQQVPLDPTSQAGVLTKVDDVVGKVLAVPVLTGQPIYGTMVASSSSGSGFSILGPTETIGPNSEAWRAVSITIPDDRAVAGLLQVGQTIDIILTATVNVPAPYASDGYMADFSTKVTYQDVVILARVASQYVIRCSLAVAEQISHFQATGTAQFSAALRPDLDVRYADVTKLGETTGRIIEEYGLPWPIIYPRASQLIPPQPPLMTPTPPPSPAPQSPAPGSPAPS